MALLCADETPRSALIRRGRAIKLETASVSIRSECAVMPVKQIGAIIAEAGTLPDANSGEMAAPDHALFRFGEPSPQVFATEALLEKVLAEAGFAVERAVSGAPTAFCASPESGEAVVEAHEPGHFLPLCAGLRGVRSLRQPLAGAQVAEAQPDCSMIVRRRIRREPRNEFILNMNARVRFQNGHNLVFVD